ncbi:MULTISPECIES: MFS transporter [Azorhizobium]|uniref:Major facilitator family transporter n=1 Tax=Azorhizobium caulinodans (strain ATCC 43989 / DSM 5975 / JCM 20966 / LMG 6465 / NBRC 14845 / NCIMB 13405 / ORS 571) TaxID=438753 RepID=A8HR27_AZOC5|nr:MULTISPECIES: MFS transporter [Azorhizobium]TDT92686.1 putative MFS family arabinose efflux permease [Azorhizobium sp. AG788]BAF87105.1 major facilitator family transporter [Azorhizobium caulinodans ORS 571]
MFSWFREIDATERKTFWACFGGWALDALDVQLFSLVIPTLLALWHISKADAGMITSVTLIASALGGWVGGAISDRIGRVRALQVMILWFALATFASAFAQDYNQLLVLKALQGLGFGGEWAAGVALMSEAIRPSHRGKALGTVQSAWAVGWGASVLIQTSIYSFVPPEIAWRLLFGLGLIPAILVIFVRRHVPEPEASPARAPKAQQARTPLLGIFSPDVLRVTLVGLLLGTGAHGGYYAVTSWLPTYLKTERHLSTLGTGAYLAVIIVAFFFGCIAAAHLLDRIGRRRTVGLFALSCVIVVLAYVFLPIGDTAMLILGFPLGFCSAGIPASMGALFSELYPGGIRGTGVGFCYNAGRIVSAIFPFLVGHLSEQMSLGAAIGIDAAVAYGLVVVAVLMLPETKAVKLDAVDAPGAPAGAGVRSSAPAQ